MPLSAYNPLPEYPEEIVQSAQEYVVPLQYSNLAVNPDKLSQLFLLTRLSAGVEKFVVVPIVVPDEFVAYAAI